MKKHTRWRVWLVMAMMAFLVATLAACTKPYGPHQNGSFNVPGTGSAEEVPFTAAGATTPYVPSVLNQSHAQDPFTFLSDSLSVVSLWKSHLRDGDGNEFATSSTSGSDYYHAVVFGENADSVASGGNPPTDGPFRISGGSTVSTKNPRCSNLSSVQAAGIDGDLVYAPKDLVPPNGSDGHVVIITDKGTSVAESPDVALSEWTVYDLGAVTVSDRPDWNGTSWTDEGLLTVVAGRKHNAKDCPGYASAAVGGRFSALFGLVRGEELENGIINHALGWRITNFSGPCDDLGGDACDRTFSTTTGSLNLPSDNAEAVFPACQSDGNSGGYIPYGTHFVLDPNWDFSGENFSEFEEIYANALKNYGAIVMDQTSGFRPLMFPSKETYEAFGEQDAVSTYAQNHDDTGTTSDGIQLISGDEYKFTPPSVLWSHLKVVDPSSSLGYTDPNPDGAACAAKG